MFGESTLFRWLKAHILTFGAFFFFFRSMSIPAKRMYNDRSMILYEDHSFKGLQNRYFARDGGKSNCLLFYLNSLALEVE